MTGLWLLTAVLVCAWLVEKHGRSWVRHYLAAQALTELMAEGKIKTEVGKKTARYLAQSAYRIADAMLEESNSDHV